jgi:heat shock protein HslJ
MRQRMFPVIVVTGLGLAMTLATAQPSLAAQGSTRTVTIEGTQASLPDHVGTDACGSGEDQQTGPDDCQPLPLTGRKWVLDPSSLGVSVPTDASVTATFTDTTVSGYTSCNNYEATYERDAIGKFSIGRMIMTARVCSSAIGAVESDFLKRLVASTQIQTTSTALLLGNKGQILLRFARATSS